MSNRLIEALDKLRKSSVQLNKITDDAAETVKHVEEFLNQVCSVGVFAAVPVMHSGNNEHQITQKIAYARVGSRYRIAVLWEDEFDLEDSTIKPWSDCSREDKLQTIGHLPALIQAIAENVDKKIQDAQSAVQTAHDVLSTFKAGGG